MGVLLPRIDSNALSAILLTEEIGLHINRTLSNFLRRQIVRTVGTLSHSGVCGDMKSVRFRPGLLQSREWMCGSDSENCACFVAFPSVDEMTDKVFGRTAQLSAESYGKFCSSTHSDGVILRPLAIHPPTTVHFLWAVQSLPPGDFYSQLFTLLHGITHPCERAFVCQSLVGAAHVDALPDVSRASVC